MFEFDDGTITVNIYVTNKKHSEDTELSVGETEFEWSRNSEDGIVIQTNSGSESFTVKKDNRLFASSLLSKDLSIEEGQIYLDAGFLKKLDNGENHLTLMLKEGCVDVTVTVIDDGQESTGDVKEITADETYFTWDRSNLIGIAVKTNSSAGNVVVTKDGQPVFSNKDKGVYITLGRVGITANYLQKLDNGENKLVFEFDDGNLSVTINVTDRKNKSGSSSGLTAERSVFTWRRNSSEGISIKTNSVSSTASVRKSGMLSLISKSSIVSFPSISDISLSVDFSFPPRNRVVSQLPTIVSALSLYSALSCDCDCRIILALISRDLIVAISLSNLGISPIFANSSSKQRTCIGSLPDPSGLLSALVHSKLNICVYIIDTKKLNVSSVSGTITNRAVSSSPSLSSSISS